MGLRAVGIVEARPRSADAEAAAIEAGAQDVESDDEGGHRFYTDAQDVDAVNRALAAAGWNVTSAVLGWRPKNPVSVDAAARAEVETFLEAIDEDDDVQRIYAGLAD